MRRNKAARPRFFEFSLAFKIKTPAEARVLVGEQSILTPLVSMVSIGLKMIICGSWKA